MKAERNLEINRFNNINPFIFPKFFKTFLIRNPLSMLLSNCNKIIFDDRRVTPNSKFV